MIKKISKIFFVLLILFSLVGCTKNNSLEKSNAKSILILVNDEEDNMIYEVRRETKEKYLLDELKSIKDLDLKTEKSDNRVNVTSIKGVSKSDNYIWTYYVNGEFETDSISEHIINDKDVYIFKLERIN